MSDSLPEELPAVEVVAAALRADRGDLETYARVLVGSLAESLPAGVVEVERQRSLSERLGGREGRVVRVRVRLGELDLELASGRHGPEALVSRQVRGVAISRKQVPVAEWATLLAGELRRLAAESSAARTALGRLLGAE